MALPAKGTADAKLVSELMMMPVTALRSSNLPLDCAIAPTRPAPPAITV